MSATSVIGLQWGDEAKGKIVDLLTDQHDIVVRYQGGNNAGHTVKFGGNTYKLSLLPAGILHDGIVSVICPGFVATSMTAHNRFPMPLLLSPARAAAIIERGLARGQARIAFPLAIYAGARVLAALPRGLVDRLATRIPAKE